MDSSTLKLLLAGSFLAAILGACDKAAVHAHDQDRVAVFGHALASARLK